jgi:hypothetical protein
MPEMRRRVRNAFADLMRNYRAMVPDDPPEQAIYTAAQRQKRQAAVAKLDRELVLPAPRRVHRQRRQRSDAGCVIRLVARLSNEGCRPGRL